MFRECESGSRDANATAGVGFGFSVTFGLMHHWARRDTLQGLVAIRFIVALDRTMITPPKSYRDLRFGNEPGGLTPAAITKRALCPKRYLLMGMFFRSSE